jgi:hypothetical protein
MKSTQSSSLLIRILGYSMFGAISRSIKVFRWTQEDCQDVNCGLAGAPSAHLLSNLINDCLLRGQREFAEIGKIYRKPGTQAFQRAKLLL